jgi:hypothetical protein
VRKPELHARSDEEIRRSIRRSGDKPDTKDHGIKQACEAVGWHNVVFTREWDDE